MKDKIKDALKENGQSLMWFWKENLKTIISYKYFIMQINGHATLREDIEKIITDFMIEKETK